MDRIQDLPEIMNFTGSEFALGRQRCRNWVCLITQQLRLRHVYQIYAYNIMEDAKASYYFTLHNTPMSSPFYTSEMVTGKNPKWNELSFNSSIETNVSSVVIRIWKFTKNGDEILLTWGVNFSGLVYLGNKITDLQPKYFEANTVIFFMQGVYFTSHDYLKGDLEKPLPFQKNLNLVETSHNKQVLYKRVAVKAPRGEIATSYSLDNLRKLQQLQREIKSKKFEVREVKERIRYASEREGDLDKFASSSAGFGQQLLTMNSLNKMLHEKPTKLERETMEKISQKIELCRFRLRVLYQERDRKSANLRRLKQQEIKLAEENEEQNSNLMSQYHVLSKESHQWDEYKQSLSRLKEYLLTVSEQLWLRQHELLKELLFIYPIDKLPNENKYTMLGIHLPDSDLLLDHHDAGVSVVLGYICHILIMSSIFLQVPLRHPMKHLGSRSVIYDQIYPDIPDKEREFPLYTKGRDRAHFNYAVFLLNKNISQLRWYLHRRSTLDMRETLRHLRNFLLGGDLGEIGHTAGGASFTSHTKDRVSTSARSLDKLVSPASLSSISSSNLNDPLLDRIHEEIRREKINAGGSSALTIKKKSGVFRSVEKSKDRKKEKNARGSSEVLAVPEAYLNRQISKDLFHRCASGDYRFDGHAERTFIKVGQGVEEVKSKQDSISAHSDSIEEGTDPLDPSVNLTDPAPTKSIDINRDHNQTDHGRVSRSVDSYIPNDFFSAFGNSCEVGSAPSCDRISGTSAELDSSRGVKVGQQRLLMEQYLTASGTAMLSSSELVFPQECLRMSMQDVSNPLTERTDRLLSTNQSFKLVKHRPAD